MTRGLTALVVGALLTGQAPALAVAQPAVSGAAAGAPVIEQSWRELLEDAAMAARTRRYAGEALQVVWTDDGAQASVVGVRHSNVGGFEVTSPERYTVQLASAAGGGMVDHEQGWFVPLPPTQAVAVGDALDALALKYDVRIAGDDVLLERPATLVEVRTRADGRLRERFWVDRDSGLVVRREAIGPDGERERLAVYLSLDLSPDPRTAKERAERRRAVPLTTRRHDILPVSARGLAALRRAGWTVPDALPRGYRARGAYAAAGEAASLQVVYTDGLYAASVFQQAGELDADELPEGAVPAGDLARGVWSWPGAVPSRVLWSAGGRTWTVVGDVPSDDLAAIVAALPAPEPEVSDGRLRRGLGRLWSLVSPWH